MSLLGSLFTGVSGLGANGNALAVIGDNIANSNTSAFKGSRPIFADILSQAMGGGTKLQIGRGSRLLATQQMFGQGTFENSANPIDMAIDGDGFFILEEPSGAKFYSRAGEFVLDKEGYVITPEKYRVQGYLFNSAGEPSGLIGSINIAGLNSEPNATSRIHLQANLDSRSNPITNIAWNVSPVDGPVSGSYNFNTTITVFDGQGNEHPISVYFTKLAPNIWQAHFIYATSTNTVNPNYSEVDFNQNAAGVQPLTLFFDENGNLRSVQNDVNSTGISLVTNNFVTMNESLNTLLPIPGQFNFTAWTGGADQVIDINFQYNANFTSQYGSPSSMIYQQQNGWTSGALRALTVSPDGTMSGVFTNGQVKRVAQVAIARFIAPTGLTKMGKNLFAESSESGQPIIGTPGTSGRGTIMSGAIEMSNVDIAEEFVRMIAAQRGFQANTRVITTSDAMLGEILNIVR